MSWSQSTTSIVGACPGGRCGLPMVGQDSTGSIAPSAADPLLWPSMAAFGAVGAGAGWLIAKNVVGAVIGGGVGVMIVAAAAHFGAALGQALGSAKPTDSALPCPPGLSRWSPGMPCCPPGTWSPKSANGACVPGPMGA